MLQLKRIARIYSRSYIYPIRENLKIGQTTRLQLALTTALHTSTHRYTRSHQPTQLHPINQKPKCSSALIPSITPIRPCSLLFTVEVLWLVVFPFLEREPSKQKSLSRSSKQIYRHFSSNTAKHMEPYCTCVPTSITKTSLEDYCHITTCIESQHSHDSRLHTEPTIITL